MGRLCTITVVAATLLLFAVGGNAAVLGFTPFRSVYVVGSEGMAVTDVAIDNANRTWYTTNKGGFVAFSGRNKVSGFPIVFDLFTPSLSSIAFADADVSGTIQDSFFIGSNNFDLAQGYVTGAQYGRVLEGSRVSFGEDLCSPSSPSYEGEITCALLAVHGNIAAAGVVNDLTLDWTSSKMWVATERGVTSIDLLGTSLSVNNEMFDAGYSSGPDYAQAKRVIAAVPALSGASAFSLARGEVHMIVGGASLTFTNLASFMTVGAITVDGAGNLWVAETTTSSSQRIIRYTAAELLAWVAGAPEPDPQFMDIFSFDPGDSGSFYTAPRLINEMSVNNGTSALWLATTKGAFFQEFASAAPVLDPKLCSQGNSSSESEDDTDVSEIPGTCVKGWHPVLQNENDITVVNNENFGAVLADRSDNVWLGSDAGFRSVIARLLTLSGTRFIGVGARVNISLTDVTVVDGDVVTVSVDVGGEIADVVLNGSGGQYSGTFGFTFGTGAPVAPLYLFPVVSTVTGIPITVTYTFNGTETLVASASWAEIIPFEDDLFIGGPCMIRAMER